MTITRSTLRPLHLSRPQRQLVRRLLNEEARRLGYGATYHDYAGTPGGPDDWPLALRACASLLRKVGKG